LYWRSPKFGDLWFTLRQLEKTICSSSEGERAGREEGGSCTILHPEATMELS